MNESIGLPHPLVQWLRGLSERERTIVQLRYLAPQPWTLEAVGRELDVTRERVRQVEQRLLARGVMMVLRDDVEFRRIAAALGIDLDDYPSAGNSETANARAREGS